MDKDKKEMKEIAELLDQFPAVMAAISVMYGNGNIEVAQAIFKILVRYLLLKIKDGGDVALTSMVMAGALNSLNTFIEEIPNATKEDKEYISNNWEVKTKDD